MAEVGEVWYHENDDNSIIVYCQEHAKGREDVTLHTAVDGYWIMAKDNGGPYICHDCGKVIKRLGAVLDCFGKEIRVGSVISYPVRHSSNMHMRKAIVRKIKHKLIRWRGDKEVKLVIDTVNPGYFNHPAQLVRTKLECFERVTVVDLSEEEFLKAEGIGK